MAAEPLFGFLERGGADAGKGKAVTCQFPDQLGGMIVAAAKC